MLMKIQKGSEPDIEVGIMDESEICFELKGIFTFGNQKLGPGLYCAKYKDGIIETPFSSRETHLTINPETKEASFVLKNVTIGIGFHWERKVDQEFNGSLILQVEDDKIRVVNRINVESYLQSVISSEMSAINDVNLLSAHAIVSRSWLLAQMQNRTIKKENSFSKTPFEITKWYDREDHSTFDVCADDHCQRYQGITRIISENAKIAIENTKGQVLTLLGEICDARFSKCCGGITEDFSNVWQPSPRPYLVAVRDSQVMLEKKLTFEEKEEFILSDADAFCNTSDAGILKQVLVDFDQSTTNFFRWKVEYDQDQLSSLLERKSGIKFGKIIDLIPLERGDSGRIVRLRIKGSEGEIIVGKELEIRKWLSESHLYSSAFVVKKKYEGMTQDVPSSFELIGAGWGHGVGMCQIGAAVMSKKGYSFREILKHYFNKVKIEKIY